MGARIVQGTTVSVQLFSEDGKPDGNTIQTTNVEIYGGTRSERFGSSRR